MRAVRPRRNANTPSTTYTTTRATFASNQPLANIDTLDPRAEGFPILRELHEAKLRTVMSNSFGFGGTNATLVFGAA